MLSFPVRPGLSKPKCFSIFRKLKNPRLYAISRASEFLTRFPWFSFLLQAPQALYSLTGYGLILGSPMALITDAYWGVIRSVFGQKPTFQGPPPSDPLGKAARYISQPAYHYAHSQMFSFEDHFLLTAADIVATGLLAQRGDPRLMIDRVPTWADTPLANHIPWDQRTREALFELGWREDIPQAPALPGLTPQSTNLEVVRAINDAFPEWIQNIGQDISPTYESTLFQIAVFEGGEDFFTWLHNGETVTEALLDPEEIVIGRIFEQGLFPVTDLSPDILEEWVSRSLELARATGRDLPGRAELLEAARDRGIEL